MGRVGGIWTFGMERVEVSFFSAEFKFVEDEFQLGTHFGLIDLFISGVFKRLLGSSPDVLFVCALDIV